MTVPVRVELHVGGVWTDLTALRDVRVEQGITITRGRADESSTVDHSVCSLTLDNRDGRYSPRNPTGAYYGLISRNTQLRVSLAQGDTYLLATGSTADHISAPDSVALSVTGDIDIRVDVWAASWGNQQIAAGQDLAAKWVDTGNQRSWYLELTEDAYLLLSWSNNGTTILSASSTVPLPVAPTGRMAVRAALDVNNGLGGYTVTFYTNTAIDGPSPTWTQLGDAVVTTAGTTSVFDSTAPVQVGAGPFGALTGRVYAFELRNGIAGTIVADPNFADQTSGATSFSDGANTWTVQGAAELTNKRYRFWGEVAEWPARWNLSGDDVYTPIEAAGILRRLQQGSSALRSTLYRATVGLDVPAVAYWPCEDESGATVLASAIPGGAPMQITHGTVQMAAFDGFQASDPIPMLGDSEWKGRVGGYVNTGETQLRFLLAVPAAGTTDGETIIYLSTTGTTKTWAIGYGTGGTLSVNARDADGTSVLATGALAHAVNGQLVRVSLELIQNGANIDWALRTVRVGAASATSSTGTVNTQTVGNATRVVVNPGPAGLDDVSIGHITVQPVVTSATDLRLDLQARVGETAGRRIERLCAEEDVPLRVVGLLDDTTAMGAQLPMSLLDLLRECEATDGGVLFEPRDALGLAYRTRSSMYRQRVALPLDYDAGHLSGLEPVEDDQQLRNDVTVQRVGGSSYRYALDEGPNSTAAPPAGAGRYDQQVTLSLADDTRIGDQASWRVHLGTVDEARYPQIALELARPVYTTPANLLAPGTFEVSVESWVAGGSVPPTVARDNTRAHSGSWSMKITWGTGGLFPQAQKSLSGLQVGASYKVSAWAWVSAGDPGVKWAVGGSDVGESTVTTGAWEQFVLRFVATADTHSMQIWANTAPTSGDTVWVDDITLEMDLTQLALDADIGDRLVVRDPPSWLPPDDISQLVQGFTDRLTAFGHTLAVNCSPEKPWQVAEYDHTDSRYSSDGSTLAEDLTTVETDVDVATPTGPLWTHDDGDFDIMIGGERMTVTAVTGVTSPQTFTVTRSVNGVVKAHATGADVQLFRPAVYAM